MLTYKTSKLCKIEIGTYDICKISLPSFDVKCYIVNDGIENLAYLHKDIKLNSRNNLS